MFTGCLLALELDSSLPFKKKKAVKRDLIDNGGVVSFIVTKKVGKALETPLLLFLRVLFLPSLLPAGHASGGEQCGEGARLLQESHGDQVGDTGRLLGLRQRLPRSWEAPRTGQVRSSGEDCVRGAVLWKNSR